MVPHPALAPAITRLAQVRKKLEALKIGNYSEIFVDHQQFVFLRELNGESILVALNSDPKEKNIKITIPWESGLLIDQLNQGDTFTIIEGSVSLSIPPRWGRILKSN